MKKYLFIVLLVGVCFGHDQKTILLSKLSTNKSNYDEYLINRSVGIHKIKGFDYIDSTIGIILVHGYYPEKWDTKGFEWVEPILNLSKSGVPIWFYRYDWNECPLTIHDSMLKKLKTLIKLNEDLKSVVIIGHSFGGLITTLLSESWDGEFPIKTHAIATGLARINDNLNHKDCRNPKKDKYTIAPNVKYIQWQTIKHQDGIFKHLKQDPQKVEIINGKRILLPKDYNGIRVGHNSSLLFVIDKFNRY